MGSDLYFSIDHHLKAPRQAGRRRPDALCAGLAGRSCAVVWADGSKSFGAAPSAGAAVCCAVRGERRNARDTGRPTMEESEISQIQ